MSKDIPPEIKNLIDHLAQTLEHQHGREIAEIFRNWALQNDWEKNAGLPHFAIFSQRINIPFDPLCDDCQDPCDIKNFLLNEPVDIITKKVPYLIEFHNTEHGFDCIIDLHNLTIDDISFAVEPLKIRFFAHEKQRIGTHPIPPNLTEKEIHCTKHLINGILTLHFQFKK